MSGIIVITGSRELRLEPNSELIYRIISHYSALGFDEVYHGDARGADDVISMCARSKRFSFKPTSFPADWDAEGRAAGPLRNGRMLDAAIAKTEKVLLLAFPVRGSTNKGTWDCIRQAFFRMVNTRIFWMEAAQ